jgi:hypothetical protein
MSASTKLVEKLEGIDNFCAWKYRIGLILAEKNINRKMNLRTQLKNTKMQKGEMIQEYFSRILEIKE